MSLISRYIFRQALFGFLVALGTLTTLVWLTQVLRRFDLMTSQSQTIWVFFLITILILPKFISILAPIALFIATNFTLNRLNSDNELVVINAAGASRWRVIAPFMVLAALVSFGIGVINLEVVPRVTGQMRGLLAEIQTDVLNMMLREGQFSGPEQNLIFHVRERNPDGELLGLLVSDERDPEAKVVYFAERGRMISDNGQNYLLMENGSFQRHSDDVTKMQSVVFSRYAFNLSQFEQEITITFRHPRERSTLYLMNPDPDDRYFINAPGKFRSELHYRLSSPLYPFMMVMIALAAVGFARTTRQNRYWGIILATAIAFSARIAGFAFGNMSASSTAAVYLLYLTPIVVFILTALFAFGFISSKQFPRLERFAQRALETQNKIYSYFARYGWKWLFSFGRKNQADSGVVR